MKAAAAAKQAEQAELVKPSPERLPNFFEAAAAKMVVAAGDLAGAAGKAMTGITKVVSKAVDTAADKPQEAEVATALQAKAVSAPEREVQQAAAEIMSAAAEQEKAAESSPEQAMAAELRNERGRYIPFLDNAKAGKKR